MPRALTLDYLIGRAKANNLRRFIRFNTVVRYVDFDEKTKEFSIEIEDFKTNSIECHKFGAQSIAVSSREILNAYKWPKTIKSVSMLVRMEEGTAHFNDGSSK